MAKKGIAADSKNTSTDEKKRPSSSSTKGALEDDNDDFCGISIMSLATSLSKKRQVPIFVSTKCKSFIVGRKKFVSHPDPRPITSCGWCGHGKESNKLCPICHTLREHGWSTYSSSSDQWFKDHNDKRMRCVKNFLLASTEYVVKAMNAMSEKNRSRLIGQYETASSELVSITSPNRQRNRVETTPKKAQSNQTETSYKRQKTVDVIIELPSVSQLLEQERGLEGVLQADIHSIYNLHFGTDANIAAKILLTLGKGDIPAQVQNETPLLRSKQALKEFSNGSDTPPSQFVGVFRVMDEERSYAVAIPTFPSAFPKEATINRQLCLIRVGIKEEKTAGQLFAYMYRILYGSAALLDALKLNDKVSSVSSSKVEEEELVKL